MFSIEHIGHTCRYCEGVWCGNCDGGHYVTGTELYCEDCGYFAYYSAGDEYDTSHDCKDYKFHAVAEEGGRTFKVIDSDTKQVLTVGLSRWDAVDEARRLNEECE